MTTAVPRSAAEVDDGGRRQCLKTNSPTKIVVAINMDSVFLQEGFDFFLFL